MAFFGEVIEPSSRSFWDGYDSDEENTCASKKATFTTSVLDETAFISKYALMIVVHDKKMTDLIRSCLVTDMTSIIATFSEEKSDDDDNEQLKSKHCPSVLYKLSDDVVLFVAGSYINESNAYALLTEVVQCMERCSEILTLCFLPLAYYNSVGNDVSSNQAVIRYLGTKSYKSAAHATLLEIPNVIRGFPAAVLTLCHFKKLSAILYVCYSDTSFIDSTTAVPILEIMKKSSHNLLTQVETFRELEKKFVNAANIDSLMSSNLYL